MKYISTRDSNAVPVSGAVAIARGLAPDGGLYVPQYRGQGAGGREQDFPAYFPADLTHKSYCELAEDIFALYLEDFSRAELAHVARAAYAGGAFPPAVAPCVQVGPFTVLELFHGPTCAFKDMALAALPHFLTLAAAKTEQAGEIVILVATSGDTGKAAQEGLANVAGCRLIVFYPAGGVSEIQERQMLSGGGHNTAAVAVRGNFDDCQRGVKAIFADVTMGRQLAQAGLSFSSANSINFGRLLPQIVYYYHAYAQMLAQGSVKAGQCIDIAVPTGNFGNILAAYYARGMGLPVRRLICASNENDVLVEAINAGHYNSRRPFHKTASPSMDILVSSNFERFLFEMYGRGADALATAFAQFAATGSLHIADEARRNWQGLLYGGSAAGNAAARTIAAVFAEHNYLLDPHTAVGWTVASNHYDQAEGIPLLLTATASPYKFSAAVLKALGVPCGDLNGEEQMQLLAEHTKTTIPAPLAALAHSNPRPRQKIGVADMGRTVLELLGL